MDASLYETQLALQFVVVPLSFLVNEVFKIIVLFNLPLINTSKARLLSANPVFVFYISILVPSFAVKN